MTSHVPIGNLDEMIEYLHKKKSLLQCPLCGLYLCNRFGTGVKDCPEECQDFQKRTGIKYCREQRIGDSRLQCKCGEMPATKNALILALIASQHQIEILEYQLAEIGEQFKNGNKNKKRVGYTHDRSVGHRHTPHIPRS